MSDAKHTPVLTITIEHHGETAIVHCVGKLVIGHIDELYAPVAALIPTHHRIILDLHELTHMDSMGLGSLLRLYVSAKARGCTIQLRNLGERVRELLVMANLLPVFSIVGEQNVRM